jgi:hypothetical protein
MLKRRIRGFYPSWLASRCRSYVRPELVDSGASRLSFRHVQDVAMGRPSFVVAAASVDLLPVYTTDSRAFKNADFARPFFQAAHPVGRRCAQCPKLCLNSAPSSRICCHMSPACPQLSRHSYAQTPDSEADRRMHVVHGTHHLAKPANRRIRITFR